MIRRPPRSTLLSLHDALPLYVEAARTANPQLVLPERHFAHREDAERQIRSEEHTSELQSLAYLVCRLLLEKKKKIRELNSDTEIQNISASSSDDATAQHDRDL